MMSKNIFKVLPSNSDKPVIDSGSCMDCDWEGFLVEGEDDEEYNGFTGEYVPFKICPKCGGGLDNFYPSSLNRSEN